MLESLIAFKRAGCDGVLTYFAPRGARRHRWPARMTEADDPTSGGCLARRREMC